ncbi:YncE family protein [Mycolicibacterium hodleri]|uniref:Tandem-95 repeat protein n=1 Tax=Mycolicibacterium hodleri TaxID=49897 RepID=A0A502E4U6_9MYCO|nr:YncE family protein [Mycolicibacterium hodleri]TPG32527.1 tandem-95 repeat protein [Mycolicibacterium hodleri]
MGYAKYVGRVGALAVVLGVGTAVASAPGVAWATPTDSSTATTSTTDTSPDDASNDADGTSVGTVDTTPAGATDPSAGSGTDDGATDPAGVSGSTGNSTEVAPGVVISSSGGANTSGDDGTPAKPARAAKRKPKTGSTSATAPTSTPPRSRLSSGGGAQTSGSTSRVTAAVTTAPTALSTPTAPTLARMVSVSAAATPIVAASINPVGQVLAAPVPAPATVIGSVLSAFSTALLGTGPGGPAESPALWVMLAAARREFGRGAAAKYVSAPGSQTATGQLSVPVSPTTIADVGDVATGAGTAAVATTNTRAYVANTDAKTVSVIDTINRVKLADIELTVAPTGLAVTPDGTKVYVVDDTTNLITVIDATTNQLAKPIDFGANREPVLLTISPDGKTLYATGVLTNARTGVDTAVVTMVSTATNRITRTVTLPGALTDVFYDTVVAPDGKKIYVIADIPPVTPDPENPDFVDSGLYVFSSTSRTATLIYTAAYLSAVAVSPDSTTVYLADNPNGEITVFDAKSTDPLGYIEVGGNPIDLVLTKDGSLLMVFDDTASSIKVLDATGPDYALLTTVPTNATFGGWYPSGVLSPDGVELYFNSEGNLQIISLDPDNAKPVVGVSSPGTADAATGTVTGGVGVTDPDLDTLTYVVTGAPTKGTVTVNPDGTFTYTPTSTARHDASADGATTALTDSFTVTVSDGRRGIVTQLITIDISPTDVDPTARTRASRPSSSTGIVKGSVTGTDKDRDPLSYSVSTGPTKGTVSIDTRGRFTYTPDADARHDAAATGATPADKVDAFTITVDDGHGGTIDQVVTVDIRPANALPTAASAAVNSPDTATGVVKGTLTASDTDLDAFSYRTGTLKKGTIAFGANGQFTYTPTEAARQAATAPNASTATKTEKFTVTIDDGHGGTTTTAVTVTIAPIPVGPVNNAPTGGSANLNTPDPTIGMVTGTVTATDPDGDPLAFAGPAGGTTPKGTVTVDTTTGAFSYTPNAAARHAAAAIGATAPAKTDTFTVTVSDGKGGTLAVPVSVTVVAKNIAPTGNSPTVGSPDATTGVVTGSVTGADVDGDSLTFSGSTNTDRGSVLVTNTGTFTYAPTADARQAAGIGGPTADSFTVTITDGHGGSATVDVPVTIAPIANGAPTLTVPGALNPDGTGQATFTAVATDPDGDSLTYGATAGHGVLTNNGAGSFTYAPDATYAHQLATGGSTTPVNDTVVVTVDDGHGHVVSKSTVIAVTPRNGDPNLTGGDPTGSPNATTGAVTFAVTGADPDSDTLSYSATAEHGTVVYNGAGVFTYTPDAAYAHTVSAGTGPASPVTDHIVVSVQDGFGGSASLGTDLTVTPLNKEAIVSATASDPDPSTGTSIITVTVSDPDGDGMVLVASSNYGSVADNGNGTFTYTPPTTLPTGVNADAVTIVAQDGHFAGVTDRTVTVPVPFAVTSSALTLVATFTAADDEIPVNFEYGQVLYIFKGPSTYVDTTSVSAAAVNGTVLSSAVFTVHDTPQVDENGNVTSVGDLFGRLLGLQPGTYVGLNYQIGDLDAAHVATTPDTLTLSFDGASPMYLAVSAPIINVAPVISVSPIWDGVSPSLSDTSLTTLDLTQPSSLSGRVDPSSGEVEILYYLTDLEGDALTLTHTDPSFGTLQQVPFPIEGAADDGPLGPVSNLALLFLYTPDPQYRNDPGIYLDSFTVTVDDGHGSIQAVTIPVSIVKQSTVSTTGQLPVGGIVSGQVTVPFDNVAGYRVVGQPTRRLSAGDPRLDPPIGDVDFYFGSVDVDGNGNFTYTVDPAWSEFSGNYSDVDDSFFIVAYTDANEWAAAYVPIGGLASPDVPTDAAFTGPDYVLWSPNSPAVNSI